MGIGARGVPNRPSVMFLTNVDCVGCHLVPKMASGTVPFIGQTFQASETACLGCHGDDYKGVLAEWKSQVSSALEKTKPVVEKARALLRSADASRMENRKSVQLARDAEYNYLFILYGKGVHNVEYATAVLDQSRADAEAALAAFLGKIDDGGRKTGGGRAAPGGGP